MVSPILGLVLDLQTERGVTLLASTITGIVCFLFVTAVHEVQGRLVRLVRLDFLDPFFGRRLRRAFDVLKRGGLTYMASKNEKANVIMQIVVSLVLLVFRYTRIDGSEYCLPRTND